MRMHFDDVRHVCHQQQAWVAESLPGVGGQADLTT